LDEADPGRVGFRVLSTEMLSGIQIVGGGFDLRSDYAILRANL
jgi:hypothetical protein